MLIAQLRVQPVLPSKLHKHMRFRGWALVLQLLFLGKEGFWVFVQIVTVLSSQTVLKWWGENPEKAPNSARQLRSLGHWWSLVRCLVTRPRNCSTQFFIFYETRISSCRYLVCFAIFLILSCLGSYTMYNMNYSLHHHGQTFFIELFSSAILLLCTMLMLGLFLFFIVILLVGKLLVGWYLVGPPDCAERTPGLQSM